MSASPPIPVWWRDPRYAHFGARAGLAATRSVVESPQRIASYAFWPFVGSDRKTRRFDFGTHEPVHKCRAIRRPAHLDANIFSYYSALLSARYESELARLGLSDVVTAYRPPCGKSNIHFAAEAFVWIRDHVPCDVYCFDVEQFFDRLDHGLLKSRWAGLLGGARLPADHFAVYSAMTRYAFVGETRLPRHLIENADQTGRYCSTDNYRALRKSGEIPVETNDSGVGIPQGVQISGVLSNLYMLGFDHALAEPVRARRGLYRRYSDDMLIALPRCASNDGFVRALVDTEIARVKLALSAKKSTQHQVTRSGGASPLQAMPPIQYLGLTYDGVRILIRGQTLGRFHRRMTLAVRAAKARTANAAGMRLFPRAKLRKRYSHIGRRNFPSYARRVDAVLREYGLVREAAVKRQLRRASARLEKLLRSDTLGLS
jgi:hypothetical protein